ncbi:MAG: hypothetical protein ACO3AW_09310 [Chitinophagaceae bacterium]
MKRLFLFVMAVLISITSYAKESYRLPFVETENGVTRIPFVEKEWMLASDRDEWSLYVEKGMYEEKQAIHEFHAATVYKKPYYSEGLRATISIIYTYGALDCRNGNLHILFEWYVAPDEKLIHRSGYEFGAYTVDMQTPNTSRSEVYNQICKEMI